MDTFTRNDLDRLVNSRSGPCVSVYLPTIRTGEQGQQNPIQFKNLLAEAEEQLIAHGQRPVAARELLAPARELLDDVRFWQEQAEGLALFVSPEGLRRWRLPVEFDRFLWVGKRFYVRPLFPLVAADDRFYVLAISQNAVRLFAGTRWTFEELDVAGLPENLPAALHYDRSEGLLEMRSGNSALPGKEGAVFYGQGGAADHHKDDLLTYFRLIDRGLHATLHDKKSPLIFAGVEYLFPIYQRANRYPHLWETPIYGNPELSSKMELHVRAKSLLAPQWEQAEARAAAAFEPAAQAGRASGELEDVLRAAHEGRIATLMVARHAHRWGTFDPSSGAAEASLPGKHSSEDLLGLAAVATYARGGEVFVMDDDKVPGGGAVAAIYRYAISPVAAGAS